MIRFSVFFLLVFFSASCFAQDEEEDVKPEKIRRSKLRAGLYVATLFPGSTTASFYDGYGYDMNDNRNDFDNSFMKKYIIDYYGGGISGQPDQVALALGVEHTEWRFDESDMPTDLKYNIAFALGLHAGFSIDGKNSINLNFTTSKLSVSGNFTIELLTTPATPQPPGYRNVKTFGITGSEQRFIFQLGYQHVFGEEGGFNFFTEGGAVCTMAKFLKNQIAINNLQIDLGSYYNQQLYDDYRKNNLTGIGFGAFAGCGLTTGSDARTTLQFVYNPSLEIISLGQNTTPSLNHYIGLRIYYNLWRRAVMKESL